MSLDIESFGAKKKPETKRSYQRFFNSENRPINKILLQTDLSLSKIIFGSLRVKTTFGYAIALWPCLILHLIWWLKKTPASMVLAV
jgi:hypothetical protein